MTQFKGTPGPWRVSGNWVETDDIPIAKIINCKPGSGTYLANKQIIAAAPELLEALQDLQARACIYVNTSKAKAAIAKATGETK